MNNITSAAGDASCRHDDLLLRVGQLTRSLHESLRELGLDKIIQRVANDDIPEARDRLLYVARMTEQAAQRVLNAVDAAGPLQEGVENASLSLASEWRALEGAAPALLVQRTLAHLEHCAESATQTRGHLLEIMMAQDFQDLTGQVIKKVTELGHNLESQLVQLLIDYAPLEHKRTQGSSDNNPSGDSLLNGPQINPQGSVDVVADQSQVDDLLESLGF